MASDIELKIAADVQQAVNGIQSVVQKLDSMQKKTEESRKSFTSLAAAFAVVSSAINTVTGYAGRLVSAFQSVSTAYAVQEQAERRLQSTLDATQNAIGMSASELLSMAEALSEVTTYTDQEIIAVEQMLIATRRISREVMPEATKAVLDMAAATGDDAAGAAHDLAQALADPAGEIESLKEKGIQLSEEQRRNIQRVQEQNGVYEAQKLLLKEVAGTYGGMAEAIADTDTGKLTQIRNAWEDIKEGLGEGLLNTIQPALDALYASLVKIRDWVDSSNRKAAGSASIIDILSLGNAGIASYDYSSLTNEDLQNILAGSLYYNLTDEQKSRFNPRIPATMHGISAQERTLIEDYILPEIARRNASPSVSYGTGAAPGMAGSIQRVVLPSSLGIDTLSETISTAVGAFEDLGLRLERARPYNVQDFLSKNGSLSSSYQIDAINEQIASVQDYLAAFSGNDEVTKYLKEINDALVKQKEALEGAKEGTEEWSETWYKMRDTVQEVASSVFSFFDSSVSLIQQYADNAAAELEELEDKWDEYFEDLDEKQANQRDSLNAMLASGNISYEDYIDAMNDLDEIRAEAEEKRADEEEEARQKANELGKAAFEADKANQIAQATANAALAITNIWASHAGNIPLAATLTALSAATTGVQIATIAAQQYTPLAAGGIVTSPTTALIGEGGTPEAILPLNDGNMDRFGLGSAESGVINLTINIGTVYSKEDLADEIFHGIERAQRTGSLPNWRYA